MARVKGPLLSVSASGSFGNGAIQFRSKGQTTGVILPALKRATAGPQPASEPQTRQRARFRKARDAWHGLDPLARAPFNARAAAGGYSNGWAAFLADYLARSIYPPEFLLLADGQPVLDFYGDYLSI